MYKHTCLYCEREFESKRRAAQFCPDKSTCRVGFRRREKRAESKAQREALITALAKIAPASARKLDKAPSRAGNDATEFTVTWGLGLVHEVMPLLQAAQDKTQK